jgi:co-chaperonin GroES (HSP10)
LEFEVTANLEFAFDDHFVLVEVCSGRPIPIAAYGSTFGSDLTVGENVFTLCLDPKLAYVFAFTDLEISAYADTQFDSFTALFNGKQIAQFTQTEVDKDYSFGFGKCGGEKGDSTGDPHFTTLAGHKFDYHGACDIVLLSAPEFNNGLGMDIHIRTKSRYEYSFIEAAAIKIGDDVFEITAYGEHMFNGVESVKLPLTMGGVVTVEETKADEKNHIFVLDIGQGETITMKSFKDLVAVVLTDKKTVFGSNVSGILGRFDVGADPIDNVARDGTTLILDPMEFAEEWQVRDNELKLFTNMERFPQYPAKCVRPQITSEERRRLGEATISEEQAIAACKTAGRTKDLDNCVYDVIATSDLEMVAAGAM